MSSLNKEEAPISQASPISRPSPIADTDDKTCEILERLRYNRQRLDRAGTVWDDLKEAEKIIQSPRRQLLFWCNQRLISFEKKRVEPIVKCLYKADFFKVVERLSPSIEALGVIAIPLVLFFAAQGYQENLIEREEVEQRILQKQEDERIQQRAVTDYLNQLSMIFMEIDGDLREPQYKNLRTLTTATTITLLRDSNLKGNRKGQVILFLSQMGLVNKKAEDESLQLDDGPTLRLSEANLREAILGGIDLRGADLREANLGKADLRSTNLSGADLSGADLSSANLNGADLVGTTLSGANLNDATLTSAKGLTQLQLEAVYLCGTRLPQNIGLNADQSCKTEES